MAPTSREFPGGRTRVAHRVDRAGFAENNGTPPKVDDGGSEPSIFSSYTSILGDIWVWVGVP